MSNIPSLSRHSNRPMSPATRTPTPARSASRASSSSRATSPLYSASTYTSSSPAKVNIVTRLAIEGKAKKDKDASVTMFLKLSLPISAALEGSTIPLFPEENVKIVNSLVHPLDSKGAPYNFQSNIRLLRHAARALNLPARSPKDFNVDYGLPTPHTTGSAHPSSSNSPNIIDEQPVDAVYSGSIIVSGYQICYVVPKEHPVVQQGVSRPSYGSRRSSLGPDRGHVQFMAAIDMVIPYLSLPPRAPYLLSIPTPRCLQNNIKLGIFPPNQPSTSFASLSSMEEDGGSWELASDPQVARPVSRSMSYNSLADDESSDSSSSGYADGCAIQGTFPSSERVRVRWAKPTKTLDIPGGASDGRRRVGVKESKGEMTCVVRGKSMDPQRPGQEGILMDVQYKGTCKNVWFPGVATMLGMDVSLEAKGSDISWVDGYPDEWKVSGGTGYTGFDVGARSREPSFSRKDSMDSSFIPPSSSNGDLSPRSLALSRQNSATSVGSSNSSLLRAPLPNQAIAEYSFEGSPSSSQTTTAPDSSMSSLPSTANLTQSEYDSRPPGAAIALHVNMNELLPPSKIPFTFTISGTVLVTPRSPPSRANTTPRASSRSRGGSEESNDLEVVIPRFTVLAADHEKTSIIVRNGISDDSMDVEVYGSNGSRKAQLQKDGYTKEAQERDKIALRTLPSINDISLTPSKSFHTPKRPRTASSTQASRAVSPASAGRVQFPSRPKRDGPLMIPWTNVTTTPLSSDGSTYSVHVSLAAPANPDSDVLEFGLADPSSKGAKEPPKVDIVGVTLDEIPVKHEVSVVSKPGGEPGDGVQFMELNGTGKDWVSWIQVYVGSAGGSRLSITYIVRNHENGTANGKGTSPRHTGILLPFFTLPVGSLEITVEGTSDYDIAVVKTNMAYEKVIAPNRKLMHFSLEGYFVPEVIFSQQPSKSQRTPFTLLFLLLATLIGGILCVLLLRSEVTQMNRSLERYYGRGWDTLPSSVPISSSGYIEPDWPGWFETEPAEDDADTSSSNSDEPPPSNTTPSHDSVVVSSALPTAGETTNAVSLHPAFTQSYFDTLAAIPATLGALTWEDLKPIASATAARVSQAISLAWRAVNWAWKFPADPDP